MMRNALTLTYSDSFLAHQLFLEVVQRQPTMSKRTDEPFFAYSFVCLNGIYIHSLSLEPVYRFRYEMDYLTI